MDRLAGESNCYLWARLGIPGGSTYTVEYESHYWGFDNSAAGAGVLSAEVDIPVTPGDLIYLTFKSYAASYSGAYAMMDWTVSDLTISSTETSLELYSWGEIKSAF